MKAQLAALRSKSYWRHGFSPKRAIASLLGAFGTVWLATEITAFFSADGGKWLHDRWLAFVLIGLGFTIWEHRPRTRFECRLASRGVTIAVRVGDVFEVPGAIVVGSNTTFDTDIASGLINKRSVQGQFTERFYDAVTHLDGDLSAALVGTSSAETNTAKPGKSVVYPIGTTAHVVAKGQRAYFVAIATINNHGVANGSLEDLKTSLPILWEYVATRGGDISPLVLPVLGSGFARLTVPREEIIRSIVTSSVAACASSRPTERMTIVIPYKDFYEHSVDLLELERYVQHVCRYTEFRSASATGTGSAVL